MAKNGGDSTGTDKAASQRGAVDCVNDAVVARTGAEDDTAPSIDDAAAAVDVSPAAGENELERRRLRRRPGFDRGVVGLSRDKDSALTPRPVVLSSSKSE